MYEKNNDRYDDIINLPRPVSKNHTPMSMQERAAQFAPFAALSGHGEAVKETERNTTARMELDEDCLALLDQKLQLIQEQIHGHPAASFVYFEQDERKSGGSYVTVTGRVKQVDTCRHCIVLTDGKEIPMEDIVNIL